MQERTTIALLLVAFVAAPAAAQTPETYLELLRSDIRTAKVEILTEAMELSPEDAKAFWPIYRQYDLELSALADRRVALIERFAENYGMVTDEVASGIADDSFAIQRDLLKLRKKYFRRVEKATSSKVAARFVQVENLIGKLIDLQIAAELPLIE